MKNEGLPSRFAIEWSIVHRKTDKKSEKIEFLRKIRPYLRGGGCKASFYRKSTWQAFIPHQTKSFKQDPSEIGGSRCNCLVSWRGMTQQPFFDRIQQPDIKDIKAFCTSDIMSWDPLCNPEDNLFKMASKPSNQQYIQGCQIASFGLKGNRPFRETLTPQLTFWRK